MVRGLWVRGGSLALCWSLVCSVGASVGIPGTWKGSSAFGAALEDGTEALGVYHNVGSDFADGQFLRQDSRAFLGPPWRLVDVIFAEAGIQHPFVLRGCGACVFLLASGCATLAPGRRSLVRFG